MEATTNKLTTNSGLRLIRKLCGNIETGRKVYGALRALCVGPNGHPSNEAFDQFGREVLRNSTTWADWIQYALGQVGHVHGERGMIPPTEQTLAEGGFMGGSTWHDHRAADAKIAEALRPIMKAGS